MSSYVFSPNPKAPIVSKSQVFFVTKGKNFQEVEIIFEELSLVAVVRLYDAHEDDFADPYGSFIEVD